MATVEELRAGIEAAQRQFREAVEAAAEQWDEGILEPEGELPWGSRGGQWSPRDAVTHALVIEQMYVNYLIEARTGQGDQPILEWLEPRGAFLPRLAPMRDVLASAASASSAIPALQALVSADLAAVDDDDLASVAAIADGHLVYLEHFGYTATKTVEGLLGLLACHMLDHARQIRTAVEAASPA